MGKEWEKESEKESDKELEKESEKEWEKEWEKESDKEWEKESDKELEKVEEEGCDEEKKVVDPENIKYIIDNLYENKDDNPGESTEIFINTDLDSELDLDMSWINDHERLSAIEENYQREPMESINMFFIYINRNLYIEKIITDVQKLTLSEDKSYSYLPKDILLQIIQSRKIKTPFSKFKLTDIISYLVDLDPEKIQSFSQNENLDSTFLNIVPITNTNDIRINPSIFIFHQMNAVYFLYEEVEISNNRHTLKSILKSSNTTLSTAVPDSKNTTTKKVRIELTSKENLILKKRNKGTRKLR